MYTVLETSLVLSKSVILSQLWPSCESLACPKVGQILKSSIQRSFGLVADAQPVAPRQLEQRSLLGETRIV